MRFLLNKYVVSVGLFLLGPCIFYPTIARALDCEALQELRLPTVTIQAAEHKAAEEGRPAHCRVLGVIGAENHFELLMPDQWNGKFLMGGGGGFVGSIQNMTINDIPGGNALQRGYATVGTDTGHQDSGIQADWALHNLERKVNFGYLAIHETAEVAKAIIRDYYERDIAYSYFMGCSRGGGQAMMESQRYPEDFDGILAGAPAYHWNGIGAAFIQNQQALYPDPGNLSVPVVTAETRALLQEAILAQCDGLDGVEDGVLDDPRACPFDPASLPRCTESADRSDCITDRQLAAVQTIYGGARNEDGPIYPGFPFGGEDDGPPGWESWITGSENRFGPGVPNLQFAFGEEMYKYLFFDDPDWDFRRYDFTTYEEDTALADHFLNARNPDLDAFKAGGGKMMIWQGWSDPAISALGTIAYYDAVEARDPNVRDYLRLFMMPGVLHCSGGPGPDRVDLVRALEDWVENEAPPDMLTAEKWNESGQVVRSRPLCPYPERAHYNGTGSTDDAHNFSCRAVDP